MSAPGQNPPPRLVPGADRCSSVSRRQRGIVELPRGTRKPYAVRTRSSAAMSDARTRRRLGRSIFRFSEVEEKSARHGAASGGAGRGQQDRNADPKTTKSTKGV